MLLKKQEARRESAPEVMEAGRTTRLGVGGRYDMSDGDNATPGRPASPGPGGSSGDNQWLTRSARPTLGAAPWERSRISDVPDDGRRPSPRGAGRRASLRRGDGRRPDRQGVGHPVGRGADAPSRRARTSAARVLGAAPDGRQRHTNPPPRSCRRWRCTTPNYRSSPTRGARRSRPAIRRRAPSSRRIAAATPRWSSGGWPLP